LVLVEAAAAAAAAKEGIADQPSKLEVLSSSRRGQSPKASKSAFMESSPEGERRQSLLVRATEPEVLHPFLYGDFVVFPDCFFHHDSRIRRVSFLVLFSFFF